MIILAHRGNVRGPERARENSLDLVEEALALGFGLETDIRFASRGHLITHDPAPWSPLVEFSAHAALWRRFPEAVIALNIKEPGGEASLLSALRVERVTRQVFLFDMELVEPRPGEMAMNLRRLDPTIRIAARVSDRGESVERALAIAPASEVWLDEFDGPWSTVETVARLKAAGRRVFAVSPELHGRPLVEAELRWVQFVTWGVDGICTDWPIRLREVLAEQPCRNRAAESGG